MQSILHFASLMVKLVLYEFVLTSIVPHSLTFNRNSLLHPFPSFRSLVAIIPRDLSAFSRSVICVIPTDRLNGSVSRSASFAQVSVREMPPSFRLRPTLDVLSWTRSGSSRRYVVL